MQRIAITCFLVLTSSVAFGQDVDFDTMLRRLAQAEKRIQQLEGGPIDSSPIYTPTALDDDKAKSSAADDDLSDRLKDLEKRFKESEDANEKLSKDYDKLTEDHDALNDDWDEFIKAEKKKTADAAKKPTFKINGRIHADWWNFANTTGGVDEFENPGSGVDPQDFFAFRRIRLEMKGDILDWGLWRIQIDFNNPQAPEMRDVYLGFKNLPYNQKLLIGNQKRPLGLDHLNSSRYNVFLERPFVIEAFNEDARRPGIAMYGHTDDEMYNWSYGAYYLENIATDGRVLGDNRQMSVNARIASSPWYDEASGGRGYYHWALSGMAAHPNGTADGLDGHLNESRFRTRSESRAQQRWLNTDRIDGADWYYVGGVESILNVGAFQLTGEFQYNHMQRDSGFSDVDFFGGYLYASYFLTGEHIPYSRTSGTIGRVQPFENFFLVDKADGSRGRGWGALNVAARYSYIDLSDRDVLGGEGESLTLAANWFWTAYSKVQFNLVYGNIDNHAPTASGFTSGDYLILGTRFAIEF